MKVMVLDCEFNQPSKKCIQIGALVYDLDNAQCVDTYDSFVNPGEPINPEIVQLTGITDRDVSNAPTIAQAFEELRWFHAKNKVFQNPIVWGSGVSNDSLALWNEVGADEPNFMGWRVIDAKSIYQSLMLFDGGMYAGGLEQSMSRLGLTFQGTKHNALTDARNTFTIWYHLIRKMRDGQKPTK
jgi:inhibitor of KinA sporulation pathway (predicted exonuclease)